MHENCCRSKAEEAPIWNMLRMEQTCQQNSRRPSLEECLRHKEGDRWMETKQLKYLVQQQGAMITWSPGGLKGPGEGRRSAQELARAMADRACVRSRVELEKQRRRSTDFRKTVFCVPLYVSLRSLLASHLLIRREKQSANKLRSFMHLRFAESYSKIPVYKSESVGI